MRGWRFLDFQLFCKPRFGECGGAWAAAIAALATLGAAGCAAQDGPEVRVTRAAKTYQADCTGVPAFFSTRHDVVAVACENGELQVLGSLGIRQTVDRAFVLDPIGALEDEIDAFLYQLRPPADGETKPRLIRFRLLAGSTEEIALPAELGSLTVTGAEVSSDGQCLMVVTSGGKDGAEHLLHAYAVGNDIKRSSTVPGEARIRIPIPAIEASGVGSMHSGSVRCLREAAGLAVIEALHTPMPLTAPILFDVRIHREGGRVSELGRSVSPMRLMWRTTPGRVALVERDTGRLAIIDPTRESLSWRPAEDTVWIDFDPSTARGIALTTVRPDAALLNVTCDASGALGSCERAVLARSVEPLAYASGVGLAGAGHVVAFDEVTRSSGSVRHAPVIMWTAE